MSDPYWFRRTISRGLLAACVAVLCVIDSGAAGIRPPSRASVLAIVGADIIPMTAERILRDHTVIVRDGVIAEVGPAATVAIPADAERIDASARYLMPGLVDAHVHLRDPSELLSYLAHGVTTIVHLSGPTGNVPDVLALRDRVRAGAVPGPTIYATGRMLDGAPPIFASVSTVVQTPEDAVTAVNAQLAAGADGIKVYNNLRADALRAVTRTAHARGAKVWGHIPRIDGRDAALQRALAAGLDVIAHGEEVFFTMLYGDVERQLDRGDVPVVGDAAIREAARLIQDSGAVVIPNLSFVAQTRRQLDDIERIWADPEARFLHPNVLATWRQQNPTTRDDRVRFDRRERGKQVVVRRLTRALREAGATLLLGTDASAPGMFPGASAHVELKELVAAGLTPYQALEAGTRNAGLVLRRPDRGDIPFGTVTPGARADLLLLAADPLDDIAHAARISGVVVRGTWYPRARLDALRRAGQ
jgi:imidazolonepropionase-like amidohydrolase